MFDLICWSMVTYAHIGYLFVHVYLNLLRLFHVLFIHHLWRPVDTTFMSAFLCINIVKYKSIFWLKLLIYGYVCAFSSLICLWSKSETHARMLEFNNLFTWLPCIKLCLYLSDIFFFVLFLFDSLRPINNLSVKQGRVFLGWTSTKLG